MKKGLILGLMLAATGVSGPALAQDRAQTLADIRAELSRLSADFNDLKAETIRNGAGNPAATGNALQRMDAMEAELARVTAKAEEIEMKLNRVVSDGTNRIGDLEFRLCEVTEGCDFATLGDTPPLGGAKSGGGAAAPAPATTVKPKASGGAELAMGEQADFDRAKGVLGQGDFRTAADLFAAFAQSYPGSPLGQEAQFNRGEALSKLGETANAARAYLEAFSGSPNGTHAAESLLKLGQALGDLGQNADACITLAEVGARFPGTTSATNAQVSMQGLSCQ